MELILGLVLIIVLFIIEIFRQIPVRTEDRSATGVWTIITGILVYTLWTSYLNEPIQAADIALWGSIALFHTLWRVALPLKLQEHPRRKRLVHILLGFGGLGLTAYALSDPARLALHTVSYEPNFGRPALTPHLISYLFAVYTWALASVHIRRWFPTPTLRRKTRSFQIGKSLDFIFFIFLTIVFPLLNIAHWFDWFHGPEGIAPFLFIGAHAMVIVAITSCLFGVHELIDGDSLPNIETGDVSLQRLTQPTRTRFDLPRRHTVWHFWKQVIPSTGFPLVFAAALLGAYHLNAPIILVASAVALFLAFIWGSWRGFKLRKPWGPTPYDLTEHPHISQFKGIEVHKKDIYVHLDRFTLRHSAQPEQPQPNDEDDYDYEDDDDEDERILAYKKTLLDTYGAGPKAHPDTLKIPFSALKAIALRPEASDSKTSESWALEDWELRLELPEYTLAQPLELDDFNDKLHPNQRLEALVDTIRLALTTQAPLTLPHGSFDPTRSQHGLDQATYNNLRSFASTWDPTLLTDDDLGIDACHHPRLQDENDPQEGWWLLPQNNYIQKGGLFWMGLVCVGAIVELGFYIATSLDAFNIFHTITVLALRVFLIAGMMRRMLQIWFTLRNPNVYALRIEDDGLNVQGRKIPWEELAAFNVLPSSEAPLYFISNNTLYGFSAYVAPCTRLPIAARMGQILPKSTYIRAQAWR